MKDKIALWVMTYLLIFTALWASFSSWSDSKLARRDIETLKGHMGQSFGMINELDKRQSLLGFQLVSIDTTIKHNNLIGITTDTAPALRDGAFRDFHNLLRGTRRESEFEENKTDKIFTNRSRPTMRLPRRH